MKTRPHSPAGLPPSRPPLPAQQASGASHHPARARQRQRGLSLLELLIALLLGLVLLGAVSTAYLANRQTFRQVENLARVNENARTTFELLGRELREAGGTPCGARLPTANVVRTGPASPWWTDWGQGLRGFDGHQALPGSAFGSGTAGRVAGTDAVVVWSGSTLPPLAIEHHEPKEASMRLHTNDHDLNVGDIAIACDQQQAAIFQVTHFNPANRTLAHHTGQAVQPGNCRKELGIVLDAAPGAAHDCSTPGRERPFETGGFLSRLSVSAWYIGHNGRGGTSLYRAVLGTQATGSGANSGRIASASPEEVIENVSNLQMHYLEPGAGGALPSRYVDASQVGDWTQVRAVRLAPTFVTAEAVGTDGKPIARALPFLVGIRTRLP